MRFLAGAISLLLLGLTASTAFCGEWYDVQSNYTPPEVPAPVCVSNCSYDSSSESPDSGSGDTGGSRTSKPAKPDMNTVIGVMVMQGVLDAMINPSQPPKGNLDDVLAAQQQAEALKAQQAARAKAANSPTFRVLQSQAGGYKGASTGSLALKGVDDDLTTLAAQSREPFDTAGNDTDGTGKALVEIEAPTPFFGDTMSEADLRLLVEPEDDPRVVDLRDAQTFIVASIKSDEDARQMPAETVAKPKLNHEECLTLKNKLGSFLKQREKFAQTIDLAAGELDLWEKRNSESLTNFAMEGIQHYLGSFQDYLTRRGMAADRLLGIYAKNANKMAKEGIDVATLATRMQALKRISTAGQLSTLSTQGQEWSGFLKDGLSGFIASMSEDNAAMEASLADPKIGQYFESEMPAIRAALDLTKIASGAEVFGKWAARKMPIVAGCELAVNQSYNALDWAMSFNRMIRAHDIYGNALNSAKKIQGQITEMRLAMNSCTDI